MCETETSYLPCTFGDRFHRRHHLRPGGGRPARAAAAAAGRGNPGSALVCVPGFASNLGRPWYAGSAACFEGERDVFEVRHSGVDHGDAVPRDLATLTASLAATVRHQLGDRPYVVVGHSMGGFGRARARHAPCGPRRSPGRTRADRLVPDHPGPGGRYRGCCPCPPGFRWRPARISTPWWTI
ncbi:hypothetical protein ACRAWF_22235 [Streptomyces sp. L7]